MASCRVNVLPLTPLGPATQEDDQRVGVLAQIDPIAGGEVYPGFEHTGADALDAREVSHFQLEQGCRHFGRSPGIEPFEPSRIRAATVEVDLFPDCGYR